MDELEIIDKCLIKIRDRIYQLFDYNSYKYKVSNVRVQQFRLEIDDFLPSLVNDLEELSRIPYLVEQMTDLIDSIDKKLTRNTFIDVPKGFQDAQNVALQSIKNTFNIFISQLSQDILEASYMADVKNEDVALSSSQVALFILYLRDAKFISDKISDTKVAEYFGNMTGYSPGHLRKAIAGVNRYERNQITDLEANYNGLKDLLVTICDHIQTDQRKAILKKDK